MGVSLVVRLRGGKALEVAVGIECRHAAGACGRDRLTVDPIGDVAGSEDTWNAGRGGVTVESAAHRQIAIAHRDLTGEELSVGVVSDGHKETRYRELVRS